MQDRFIIKVLQKLGIPAIMIENPGVYDILREKILDLMVWYEEDILLSNMSESALEEKEEYDIKRIDWLIRIGKDDAEAYTMRILQDFEKMSEEEYNHFIQYITDKPIRLPRKKEGAARKISVDNDTVIIDESEPAESDDEITILDEGAIESNILEISINEIGEIECRTDESFPRFTEKDGREIPQTHDESIETFNKYGCIISGERRGYVEDKLVETYLYNPEIEDYEEIDVRIKDTNIVPFISTNSDPIGPDEDIDF